MQVRQSISIELTLDIVLTDAETQIGLESISLLLDSRWDKNTI